MTSSLQTAIAHHRAGRLGEAEAIYRELLAADGNNAEALHLLGLIACQLNQLEAAEQLIQQAVVLSPQNGEYWLNLGEIQRRQNHLGAAIASLRRAAELAPQSPFAHYNLAVALAAQFAADPQPAFRDRAIASYENAIALQTAFPEALNNLGLLFHSGGRLEEAIACFRRAIPLRAAYAEANTNLGISLWANNQLPEAIAAFRQALAANANFAPAHSNLGLGLRILGQRTEALAALRRAAELMPASADAERELCIALIEIQLPEEATAAARRAVALAPHSAQAHRALAVSLAAFNPPRLAEAVVVYRHAIALNPNPAWQFELDSLEGNPGARSAPDAYVRMLFDNYAPRFESHLVDELGYCVPQDFLEIITRLAPVVRTPSSGGRTHDDSNAEIADGGVGTTRRGQKKWDILDLGCGTGLCGALFHDRARTLVGVDLSPNMIARARQRNIYTELIIGPLLDTLRDRPDAFDLILAGDVFNYVGDLAPVLTAAAGALRANGLLACSLEHHDQADLSPEGFVLHHRQRFAHSMTYVRSLAARLRLHEVSATPTPLRKDIPPGWIFVLGKT